MVSPKLPREDKTSAAWVEARVDAILSSYDDETVGRAMPVLVVMLADAYGPDRLDPDMQAILQKVGHRIGLEEGMENAEVRHLTATFVEGLAVNPDLLEAHEAVFEAHEAAREAASTRRRRRLDLGFNRPSWSPREAPIGTPSSNYTAQTLGMILMR